VNTASRLLMMYSNLGCSQTWCTKFLFIYISHWIIASCWLTLYEYKMRISALRSVIPAVLI